MLLETGWIRMRGRRRAPGRPVTYGTTEAFLSHFGLDALADLPGVDELRAAGLLDSRAPADLAVPEPGGGLELAPDEDPLEDGAVDPDEPPPRRPLRNGHVPMAGRRRAAMVGPWFRACKA